MKTTRLICVVLFTLSMSLSLHAIEKEAQKLLGTWEFYAPSAPYPYSEGAIVFKEVDKKMSGEFNIQGKKISTKEVTFVNDEVTVKFEVENVMVIAKLKLMNNELVGNADSSQGLIPVKAKLKK